MLKLSTSRPASRDPGQQIVECYAELLLGIITEVLLDEGRSEPVKAGGHCGVRGEEVPARVTASATSKAARSLA